MLQDIPGWAQEGKKSVAACAWQKEAQWDSNRSA
jgi:hypothetical protein